MIKKDHGRMVKLIKLKTERKDRLGSGKSPGELKEGGIIDC